jgi:hypothetical protein
MEHKPQFHLPRTEDLEKKTLKLEEKLTKAKKPDQEDKNPEEREEERDEVLDDPASLYGQNVKEPFGVGHSAMHLKAHMQRHPGVRSPEHPPHEAPHHHLELINKKQKSYSSA